MNPVVMNSENNGLISPQNSDKQMPSVQTNMNFGINIQLSPEGNHPRGH